MLGRFVGSAVLRRLPTGPVLGVSAVCSFTCILIAVNTHGHVAMYELLAVGLCNSIMFPSIFSLGIQGLGPLTSKGSSLMIQRLLEAQSYPWRQGSLQIFEEYNFRFFFLHSATSTSLYLASLAREDNHLT